MATFSSYWPAKSRVAGVCGSDVVVCSKGGADADGVKEPCWAKANSDFPPRDGITPTATIAPTAPKVDLCHASW